MSFLILLFFCFFLIYNIIVIVIILCLLVLCNSVKHILELNDYFEGEEGQFFFTIIKCYADRCVQNAGCRLHTAGVGLSFLESTD